MHISDWLQRLDHFLTELVASWHGMLNLAMLTSIWSNNKHLMSSGTLKCPRITEPEASRHQSNNNYEVQSNSRWWRYYKSPKRVSHTDVPSFPHSLAITTRHMFFFNQCLSRGIHFSRASEMEPWHNTKTKTLKLDNKLSYKGNMYCRRNCLKWRFSLILNSPRVSTCLMILGRVL